MKYHSWLWLAALILLALGVVLIPYRLTSYKASPSLQIASGAEYVSWMRILVLDPVLGDLAECESNSNPGALNPKDTDGLEAHGLFQYKQTTWDAFNEEMGFTGNIYSPHDQIKVTKWALDNGKAYHWGICL